jgi:hypothetical protein
MVHRCVLLALLVACAGCEAVSGINDFTTAAAPKSSDGGDAEAGAQQEAGQDEGGLDAEDAQPAD